MVIKEGDIYHIKETRLIGNHFINGEWRPVHAYLEYICKIGPETTKHTGKNRKNRRHKFFVLKNIKGNRTDHEMSTIDLFTTEYKKLNGTGVEVLYEQKSSN